MGKYASEVVKLAKSWVGIKEGSEGHKMILDIYNSQADLPGGLPRGYRMKMSDPWCAATTTALAVKLGYTDIIPCECSCTKLIEIAKSMGIWIEDESITPTPGMLALYCWSDKGQGDCTLAPDHVGVVKEVEGGDSIVIEGNYDGSDADSTDGVERRTISLNSRYLRGFIAPKYDPEPMPEAADYALALRYLRLGDSGEDVRALQFLLIGRGYCCGLYGANGVFTNATQQAVLAFQKDAGIAQDGIVGQETMQKLIGV